jgi:polyferredoxin
MELRYRILADVVVAVHFAYVAFVILGLVLTLAGAALGWRWVRNFWFRAVHLVMIAIVVGEAWCGITCPLTTWENALRQQAGQAAYRGGFLANLLHDTMFFDAPFFEARPWVFTMAYTLFGLAVVGALILAPPRPPSFARGKAAGG